MTVHKKTIYLGVILLYLLVHIFWKNALVNSILSVEISYLRAMQLLLLVVPVIIYSRLPKANTLNLFVLVYFFYTITQYIFLGNLHWFDFVTSLTIFISYIVANTYGRLIELSQVKTIFYFLAVLILCGYIISYIADPSTLVFTGHEEFRGLRYTLGLSTTNQASIEIMLLIYGIFFLNRYSLISLNFFLSLLILATVLLFVINTRAGIISYMIFIFFTFYFKYHLKYKLLRFLSIFLLFLSTLSVNWLIDYFNKNESQLSELSSGRTFIWINEIQNNLHSLTDFVFGVGYGNAVKYNAIFTNSASAYHVDNFYMDIFIQQGVVGLLFVLTYVFFIVRLAKTNMTKAMIVSVASYGMFESVLFSVTSIIGFLPLLLIFIEKRFFKKC